MFTEEQKRLLVALARTAVTHAVSGSPVRMDSTIALPDATGAFVTLKRGGRLRGCIGTLQCRGPLAEEVARVAVSAARSDPRFPPVEVSELTDLDVEVSILGPLEAIDPNDPLAFEIGRHGLVVERGHHRGLLLPQVAVELNWDRETFLSQTCVKAGLEPDASRRGARVYRFVADVFGEGVNP